MSTYEISGLDWQTAYNNRTEAPSFRERDGMIKVEDSFYEGEFHSVDAVLCEGYLRGLNYALRMLWSEIRMPTATYKRAYKNLAEDLTMKREMLLEAHDINPADDEALHSNTPFIDALSKKEAIDND